MTISATMIADSISPQGKRLRCFQVTCHRFILPEVNTHRVFSRNWASSRAIPTAKLIQMVRENPATPIHWGKNQPGMQAFKELSPAALEAAQVYWRYAASQAVYCAQKLEEIGAHKQLVNRVLEPFLWVRGVISSTEMENFYALRRHPDAQPEIKALADAMWEAEQVSTPTLLQPGQWHLPYIKEADYDTTWTAPDESLKSDPAGITKLIKVSVARCARVSYLTHDGRETTVEEDAALYDRLVGSMPLHASPAEHQATPDTESFQQTLRDTTAGSEELIASGLTWDYPEQHGNFTGWIQYRKTLPGEFTPG